MKRVVMIVFSDELLENGVIFKSKNAIEVFVKRKFSITFHVIYEHLHGELRAMVSNGKNFRKTNISD